MKLRVLSARDVRTALPMDEAIEGMKLAFAQLSTGRAQLPLRTQLDVPRHDGVSLFMPAYLPDTDALAVKVVSVFPNNIRRSLPTIHGLVLALETSTGRPLALLEGGTLTAIRTGAASGAATDLLARRESTTVAIFGSGVQARTQLEAVCTIRNVEAVRVYSPNRAHAAAFAEEMRGRGAPIPTNIDVVDSPADAIRDSDIICTATTSTTPVFPGELLAPGSHVNAVGSFRTDMQEVDVETVQRSLVVVDSREAALAEAGDLVVAIESDAIGEEDIYAELGEIASGSKAGRTSADQITYFKSVGVAVQDAVAAAIALENAERNDWGVVVEL